MKRKKALVILLIFSLAAITAACGNSGVPSSSGTPSVGTSGTSASAAPNTASAIIKSEDMPGHPGSNAKYGGFFRSIPFPFTNMNKPIGLPWNHQLGGAIAQIGGYAETLLVRSIKDGLHGWLAESWEVDMDKEEVLFKLREGIRFTDGSPMNAEVAAWNINMGIEAKQHDPAMVRAEARGEYEVAVVMNPFTNSVWASFSTRPFAFVSKADYENNGAEKAENWPIGTGPFVLEEFLPGIHSRYVKNENYWIEGRPYVDGMEFAAIFDVMTANMAIQSVGEDGVDHLHSPYAEQIYTLTQMNQFTVLPRPVGANCLVPSSNNPDSPWADINVRKAISYAIDRDAIVDARGFGLAVPEYQFLPDDPGIMGRLPESDWYIPYDPAKAKELLAAGGYPDGFTTTYYGSATGDRDIPVAIATMLEEIGVVCKLEFPEGGVLTEMREVNGWEGLVMGQMRAFTDVFRSFNLQFDYRYAHYKSAWRPVDEVEKAFYTGVRTPFPEAALAENYHRLIMDNYLVVPVYTSYEAHVIKKDVFGTGADEWDMGLDLMLSGIWLDRER